MRLEDFRSLMINNVREFDKWAWKDQMENPQDWEETMTEQDWLNMFNTFIEDVGN